VNCVSSLYGPGAMAISLIYAVACINKTYSCVQRGRPCVKSASCEQVLQSRNWWI